MKRGISLLLVVGAFFAMWRIFCGRESAADNNADAIIRDGIVHSANGGNFAEFYKQRKCACFPPRKSTFATKRKRPSITSTPSKTPSPANFPRRQKRTIGINLIAHSPNRQNNAIGWQLRRFRRRRKTAGLYRSFLSSFSRRQWQRNPHRRKCFRRLRKPQTRQLLPLFHRRRSATQNALSPQTIMCQ